jgi:hypothetical protein
MIMTSTPSFHEAALLADASARAGGLTDFGPETDGFRANLGVLVESTLAEAQLRDPAAFRDFLLHCLANRLRIQHCLARHPEIADVPIVRPAFISGLPRAGTTTFSRLVGEDAQVRTLRLWELVSPAPSDLAHPWALTEDRIARAEQLVVGRARRGTLDIRPMSIFLPDECFYLFRNSLHSDHLHRAVARRPRYFQWIRQRDPAGAYAYYRTQLQLLLWQRPVPRDGQLVLKNPFLHVENPTAIFELFPDATIVNLTRDVASVMKSLCFKNRADRRAHCEHVSDAEVGADMVDNLELYYQRRAAELDRLSDAQRARIVTIDFDAWAGDPVAIMRRYYAHIDRPFTAELAARMTAALAHHQRYGEQARYDLGEFGLDADALRARLTPYEHAFRRRVTTIEAA